MRSYGRTTLAKGESAYVTLSWDTGSVPASSEEATAALNATIGSWRDWLTMAKVPDHPWLPRQEEESSPCKYGDSHSLYVGR